MLKLLRLIDEDTLPARKTLVAPYPSSLSGDMARHAGENVLWKPGLCAMPSRISKKSLAISPFTLRGYGETDRPVLWYTEKFFPMHFCAPEVHPEITVLTA
jgi:hypothetical protein